MDLQQARSLPGAIASQPGLSPSARVNMLWESGSRLQSPQAGDEVGKITGCRSRDASSKKRKSKQKLKKRKRPAASSDLPNCSVPAGGDSQAETSIQQAQPHSPKSKVGAATYPKVYTMQSVNPSREDANDHARPSAAVARRSDQAGEVSQFHGTTDDRDGGTSSWRINEVDIAQSTDMLETDVDIGVIMERDTAPKTLTPTVHQKRGTTKEQRNLAAGEKHGALSASDEARDSLEDPHRAARSNTNNAPGSQGILEGVGASLDNAARKAGTDAHDSKEKKGKGKKRSMDGTEHETLGHREDGHPLGIPFAFTGQDSARSVESAANGHRSETPSTHGARVTSSSLSRTRPNDPVEDLGGLRAGMKNSNGSSVAATGRKRPRDGEGGGRRAGKHGEQRSRLPISAHRSAIMKAVEDHQTVIVVGETGSGKSTQIPQFLYEAGMTEAGGSWIRRARARAAGGIESSGDKAAGAEIPKGFADTGGMIACTQPRRVAAVSVAKRVAAEAQSELGHVVGYSVRFDDRTSRSTRIRYMTDGVLLREAMSDHRLSAYSAIVLDEAHERSLDTDVLFGLIRRLQPQRPDLRVVVMSATLDVDLFQRFFRDAVSVHVPGRSFPVDVMYATEDQDDYLDACLITCLQIHEEAEGDGDVLVFLPGQDDIEALAQLLSDNLSTLRAEKSRELAAAAADAAKAAGENIFDSTRGDLQGTGDGLLRASMVCPIFAALPQEQQLAAFEPAPDGTRKFVLATNIAETSITIAGIRYVVDSGKVKVRSYQPATGMEFLRSQDVSKAQATQRAGRAGREGPGVCYRLYREDSYLELGDAPMPEILRVNLAQVVLQLKVMGIDDPATFDYVTAPSRRALVSALESLVMLGALDKTGALTTSGQKMACLPLDPTFAHLLVRSTETRFSCVKEALTAVACLSAENLLFYPAKEDAKRAAKDAHRTFAAYDGDLPTLLRIFESFVKERKDPTWCRRNYVNGRSLARAFDVREQLAKIVRTRLRVDPEESCGAEMSQFLRCLVAGLFTKVALRQAASIAGGSGGFGGRGRGRGGGGGAKGGGRACYRTVIGQR